MNIPELTHDEVIAHIMKIGLISVGHTAEMTVEEHTEAYRNIMNRSLEMAGDDSGEAIMTYVTATGPEGEPSMVALTGMTDNSLKNSAVIVALWNWFHNQLAEGKRP